MKKVAIFILLCLNFLALSAQPRISFIKVEVTPDHTDWLYRCGEKPQFDISVRTCSNAPVRNAEIYYEVSEDMMPPLAKGNLTLKDGTTTIKGYTMQKPGFLQCRIWATVDGKRYDECATVGFDVEKIVPKTIKPDDFEEFWRKSLALNDNVEMLPEMTLIPERCTSKVDVYLARFQNFRKGSYIYGTMCVPKNLKGKAPAILIVPGAGCRAREGYMEEAEQGIVTLEIGIHGIPTNLFDKPSLYSELRAGGLINYWLLGIDNKEQYFYRRVYIGCSRAVDFLAQLDFVDENNIAVTGWSQGGALTLVTSYLNPKVKYAAAIYPAMCDLTGRLYDQGDAWPRIFRNKENATKERIETVSYYDVVNFAKGLKIPLFFTYGYNDLTVCPTSMQGAYNVTTAPKELMVVPQSRHFTYPEQREARSKWLVNKLLNK